MAQRNLADLPVEILQHIARLIRDTHKPSFYAFCVTNKRYRLTFVSLIFRELHVSVNDCRALRNDVNLLLKSLLSTVCGGDVTQHVRHLCLKGSLSLMKSDGSEVADDFDGTTNHEDQLQRFQLEGLNELLDEKSRFSIPPWERRTLLSHLNRMRRGCQSPT